MTKTMIRFIIQYILKHFKTMSVQLIYSVLLMVFAYKSPNTPVWAKRIILGGFAYLLSPIDSIPDLTPVLGFTDDLSVISFGLVTIAGYIDNEIRDMAKSKLAALIQGVDTTILEAIDAKL